MLLDTHYGNEVRRMISPIAQANADTAIVSQIIDLANIGGCEILVNYGDITDSNVTSTALLEESNASDMSGANAVDDADLLGLETDIAAAFGDDFKVGKLGYKGTKRYIRLTITPSGNNSGNFPVGALAFLTHARKY